MKSRSPQLVCSLTISFCMVGIAVASLAALVPPKLIPLSRIAQLRKGERYHVTCSTSDGSPPLTFTWSKDGENIEPRENPPSPTEIGIRRLDEFSTSLVVEDVQEQHTGNYSCTVANAAGRDSGTTSLQVLFPPIWVRPPSDVSVVAGSKINLHCEAKGSPKPTITWRKNTDFSAMDFDVIHSDGRLRISDDGQSLKIPEAKKEDEGFYECHVTNGIGDQLRKSIRVEVQVPPKVAAGPSSMVVEKNKDVNIQCNMTGDSPLNIMWEKNGRPLESRKPKIQIQEFPTDKGVTSSLLLLHVDRSSSGLYVCKAKNSYGESYRIINVDVVEIPGQPKDLIISQIWSRSLQLTWEPPYHGNRPITAYIIHYWKTEGKSEPPPEKPNILRIASLQTVAVVPKLLPNSFYSLYVMAENEVGMGPPSETVTATTREEEPDWAPTEVTVLDKHATSTKLRWKCPPKNDWNAPLKGYYVGYKRMSTKTAYTYRTLSVNVCKDHQEFVLQGLQRASSYMIIVRAFNHVGNGPASEQVVVHTADGGPPRTPHVKVIQTGGVTCNIKIWPRENSRSLPTAFIIHVREQNGDRHKIHVSVLPSQNYSVGGLSPGRQYEIFVTAKNRFGESAASATIKIITDQNDPSLLEPSSEPVYEKMYFILPIVLSAIAIIIMPIIACYCHNKLNPRPITAELIEDRDFLYAAATLHRLEATLRRASAASATLSRPVPARTSSLPRPSRSGRVITTTLPKPEPQPVPEPEPSPALPTSYSTLQNYGTAVAENEPSTPPVNKATISVPDDGRYDSVVEEMRTFIKDKGSTKPKKVEAEVEMEDDSSDEES
ncbi:down syndrome cell adhesion molecule-like protein Dscam2 [Nephila pilipes]|uniref:Down syndrome cell adhesion molecule-like protein Dscam2 n=1 Tax=Nephila pilipes TaxID=299642 RepID=A0A8X6PY74_NEPPI|nr:down syndrome cell adhesion molecule-like protein Dscam2 [Nephila pilipes]